MKSQHVKNIVILFILFMIKINVSSQTSGSICQSSYGTLNDGTCSGSTYYNSSQSINIESQSYQYPDPSDNTQCLYQTIYYLTNDPSNIQTLDGSNSNALIKSTVSGSNACDFSSTPDEIAVSAHWGTQACHDFYDIVFGRTDGIDNANGLLQNVVHESTAPTNAGWVSGSSPFEIDYGDGGTNTDGSTVGPQVNVATIGHEYTHGITENIVGDWDYDNTPEAGALSESLSDMFGIIIAQGVNSSYGWIFDYDSWISGHSGTRNFSNPSDATMYNSGPKNYHASGWLFGSSDSYGAHTNCLVGDYWFYLLSLGGSGTNDFGDYYCLTGIGTTNALKIVYDALPYLTTTSTYADFASAVQTSAQSNFPNNNSGGAASNEYIQVVNALYAVGLVNQFNQPIILQNRNNVSGEDDENIGSITATNFTVLNGTTCTFTSEGIIYLENSFKAQQGSNFHAYLNAAVFCQSHSRVANQNNNNNNNGFTVAYSSLSTNNINNTSANIIKNKKPEIGISIYPNPTNDLITIDFTNTSFSTDKTMFNLYNTNGQIIMEQSQFLGDDGQLTFNLSTLAPGMYNVIVMQGAKIYQKKIIKQ